MNSYSQRFGARNLHCPRKLPSQFLKRGAVIRELMEVSFVINRRQLASMIVKWNSPFLVTYI